MSANEQYLETTKISGTWTKYSYHIPSERYRQRIKPLSISTLSIPSPLQLYRRCSVKGYTSSPPTQHCWIRSNGAHKTTPISPSVIALDVLVCWFSCCSLAQCGASQLCGIWWVVFKCNDSHHCAMTPTTMTASLNAAFSPLTPFQNEELSFQINICPGIFGGGCNFFHVENNVNC